MLSKWTIMGRWATWRASRSGLAGIITEPGRLTLGLWWQVRPMPMPLTRKVNAFAGVCISVYLHCNSRNCSQPAKKFRGFPFFQLPISINSDLFRISDFGFRISDFRLLPGCAKGPRFKDGAHRSPAKARSVAGPMPMPE